MWKQELPKNPQHSSYPALMSAPCIQYPRYSASPARSLRTTTHTVLAAMIQTQPWYLSLIYRNSIISVGAGEFPRSASTLAASTSLPCLVSLPQRQLRCRRPVQRQLVQPAAPQPQPSTSTPLSVRPSTLVFIQRTSARRPN